MQSQATDVEARPPAKPEFGAKSIFAAVLGNGFEFYDFGVYAAYTGIIAKAFFASTDSVTALLLSAATFGVGFIARPIGGIVIGAYGDRAGRKPAMTLTIGLMALGSAMIGFLPTYATIGIAAPILLVLARLIQGFSAGGEMGPATMFMIESAPKNRRCFYGSWQIATQNLGSIVVGLGGFLIAHSLTPEDLNGWGWRIPFCLGILIAPVGIYIRNRLHETLEPATAEKSTGTVMTEVLRTHWLSVVLGVGLISGGTITQYFLINMTNYAITVLKMPTDISMLGTLVMGITGGAAALIGGMMADRWGLTRVIIWPRLLLMALLYPLMAWLVANRDVGTLAAVMAVLMLLNAASSAPAVMLIPKCFPAAIRSAGLSFTYAMGVTIFGGTATYVVIWLVGVTGNPLASVYYVFAANIVMIVSTLLIRAWNPGETRVSPMLAGEASVS